MLFHDRRDAGRQLAARLMHYGDRDDVLVLALPRRRAGGFRGCRGTPGAARCSWSASSACRDNTSSRWARSHPAASASSITRWWNSSISPRPISPVEAEERRELQRREREIAAAGRRSTSQARSRSWLDDGLATGSSMRAAVRALRALGPAHRRGGPGRGGVKPARSSRRKRMRRLRLEPEPFHAVGLWYEDFHRPPIRKSATSSPRRGDRAR